MIVEIEKVYNGYIISEDNNKLIVEIKGKKNEVFDEQLAFRDLISILKEKFEVWNDKHTNQYLDVTITNEDKK